MSVTLLAAAKCPMGCGTTLEVNEHGTLRCFAQDCPRREAAELVLSTTETEHVVQVTGANYTIQHPLRERLQGALFECPMHAVVSGSVQGRKPGVYRMELDDLEEPMWTFLAGPDAHV